MRALVIDDNPGILMLMTDILSDMGVEVIEAADCKIGWELLQASEEPFDFHLIDWMTPQLSGLELLKLIKADARYQNSVNIMVTGLSEVEEVTQALEAGANEYLMKPFTKEMLENKLSLAGINLPHHKNDADQSSQGGV